RTIYNLVGDPEISAADRVVVPRQHQPRPERAPAQKRRRLSGARVGRHARPVRAHRHAEQLAQAPAADRPRGNSTNQRPNLREHQPPDQLPLDELAADHLGGECAAAATSDPPDDGSADKGQTAEGPAAAAAVAVPVPVAVTFGAQ
ncbi:hypothetical protein pipiens_000129, partial [Culex pipiens pipiens]